MTVALIHFAARAGDHNDRAMRASPLLASAVEDRLGVAATVVGVATQPSPSSWGVELSAAMSDLRAMSLRVDEVMSRGEVAVTALSRCAVALATLPVVARRRSDAVVVWFDAHADLNTPENSVTGYLGGLALSGPLGLWDSGLGSGLAPLNTLVVGARDLDVAERALLGHGEIGLIAVAPDMSERLRLAVAGRPVYVHIDCDVLQPGLVATDYRVDGGMSLEQLTECLAALAFSEVVGVEVGELETAGDGAACEGDRESARVIVRALEPLFEAIEGRR